MTEAGSAPGQPWRLVFVPHTHWDREWYLTHEQFRFKLVQLVDGLLDLLESDADFRHFTLDGQSIVLDDYLAIRPHARERIEKLVASGRLLVGPWTVLPDEWLVSGEALVRNLRLGLGRADALGGSMRFGYVPDQFGHVGQLPQIFRGFGFDAAALWRGVGETVEETLFDWEAPSGHRVLTAHLSGGGYSNAANLPRDPEAVGRRVDDEIGRLAKHARVSTLLMMAGTDHQSPDPELPAVLRRALGDRSDVRAEIGTLPGYLAAAREALPDDRSLHRGELRSTLRAHLLPGCASARMPQKRQDFCNDRLVVHAVEPLSAWLRERGGRADPELLEFVWRLILENHPHDSICGCSIDEVHEQMEPRFARVREIAEAELERVFGALAADLSRPAGQAGPWLCVFSPNPAGRTPFESEVELEVLPGDDPPESIHLAGFEGVALPTDASRIAPAEAVLDFQMRRESAPRFLDHDYGEMLGYSVQDVSWDERGEVPAILVHLGHGQRADAPLREQRAAVRTALAQSRAEKVRLLVLTRERWRVAAVDVLPAHGLRGFLVCAGAGPAAPDLGAGASEIRNQHWTVSLDVASPGRLALEHHDVGRRIDDALRLVSEGDRGDEYNFDPVEGGPWIAEPESVSDVAAQVKGARAQLSWTAEYRVPTGLADDRRSRSLETVLLPARIEITLWSRLDRVDVAVELDNRARDHRFRLWLATPEPVQRFEVESAFEVATRPIEPVIDEQKFEAERPVGATPQRGFASALGRGLAATVANRGLAEVEAFARRTPDGAVREAPEHGWLAVTLLRAVGWLSRGDLKLRPQHAGPPFATPGAQVPGPHRGEVSLRWHACDERSRTAEAHRFARATRTLQGTARPQSESDGASRIPDASALIALGDPRVVVSAIEPVGDGLQLRLYNASADAIETGLRWGGAPGRTLQPIDLEGRRLDAAALEPDAAGTIPLTIGPWEIRTFAVRGA